MIGQSSAPLSYLAFSGNWCSITRQKYDDEPFLHFCLFPCTCVCVFIYIVKWLNAVTVICLWHTVIIIYTSLLTGLQLGVITTENAVLQMWKTTTKHEQLIQCRMHYTWISARFMEFLQNVNRAASFVIVFPSGYKGNCSMLLVIFAQVRSERRV